MGGLGDHIQRLPRGLGEYLEPGALDRLKPAELKALRDAVASRMPSPWDSVRQPRGFVDLVGPDALKNLQGPEMRVYEPTYRENVQYLIGDGLRALGVSKDTARFNAKGIVGMAEWTPFGLLTAMDDANRAWRQGDYPDAVLAASGAIPGGGLLGKGLKEGAKSLAMDTARMERAASMGFRTETPIYHGSAWSFPAFDPAKRGRSTGTPAARVATWHSLAGC